MEAILDFNVDLDVAALDRVVATMFQGSGPEQQSAQRFQEHPDACILSNSASPQTKYIALQIMEKLITTRWKALPEAEQQGVRNFIVEVIIATASDESSFRREKAYLAKLNLVLVQVLKQEWPHKWPAFIPEIVSSSRGNINLCENNLVILKLLSEEVFDFSAEQMTTAKVKTLKNSMAGEFADVFSLLHSVLTEATKPSLIRAALETFLRFLNWIPLGYIFETDIIDQLVNRYLEPPEFRNVTLKCLSEIGALQIGPEYNQRFVILFQIVMSSINKSIPPSTDIANVYATSSDSDQELVLNLALFLTNFLSAHLRLVETPENEAVLLNAHLYLVKISQVEEREVFKICLEYWSRLVTDLYEEIQALPMTEPLLSLNLGAAFPSASVPGGPSLRKTIYREVLSNLRMVMVSRMAKPEEVLVVENDEGEVVREFVKEVDTVVLYKAMREVLVYLCHLDVQDTEQIMTEKLARQMDGSEWSWHNLNTLCWAIGSISGAMNEESEKRFLVNVIKDLLSLTEAKRGKDNKAVVASDIMYIVGQYPRFLKAHWKFLKTVVNKLFEFMHETHEGVQDMACDTFIKIAQKCRRHFVMQQSGETEPFIDEILRNLDRITMDLQPAQVHTVFEAVGYMIAAQPNKSAQERLIAHLMALPNAAWDQLMAQAAQTGPAVLADPDNIKKLANVLKTNVAACSSIGTFFLPQIGRIYADMLGLYKAVSSIISDTIAQQGLVATKTPKVRGLRTIKKEILKLVDTHVRKCEDVEQLNTTLVPPLLEAILSDYQANVAPARDAEVLNVLTTIVTRLGSLLLPRVPDILRAVFECTLEMISKDFTEYPEHRVGFYKLLRAVNLNCFSALLQLEPAQFKLLIDSLLWGIKHTTRDVADTSLSVLLELVSNVASSDAQTAAGFFSSYYISLLQDTFYVLSDTDHRASFKWQVMLLQRLISLVAAGHVTQPDAAFVKKFSVDLLHQAFGHVQLSTVQAFADGLFELHADPVRFKVAVRDFLISLKEYSASETVDMFADEREAKAAEERAKAAAVPGMLKARRCEVLDALRSQRSSIAAAPSEVVGDEEL